MQRFATQRIAARQRWVMSSWQAMGHHQRAQKQARAALHATSAWLVSCALIPVWRRLLRASILYQTMLMVRNEPAPLLKDWTNYRLHVPCLPWPDGSPVHVVACVCTQMLPLSVFAWNLESVL